MTPELLIAIALLCGDHTPVLASACKISILKCMVQKEPPLNYRASEKIGECYLEWEKK